MTITTALSFTYNTTSLILYFTYCRDMASGPAAFASSTRENTNYARLCRLLIDIGTETLRNIVNGIHYPAAASLHKILSSSSSHYSTLQCLKKRGVLNPTLWGKLSTSSSAEFDITLLMVLLRNVCGLSPPVSTGNWDELPPESDNSTEANIVRIKFFRNDVYAHASKASINDATFNQLWKNISNAIIGLESGKNVTSCATAIGKVKTECMDPDTEAHFRDLLNDWKKYDYNTKEMLEELTGNQEKAIEQIIKIKENQERTHIELGEMKDPHDDQLPVNLIAEVQEHYRGIPEARVAVRSGLNCF